MKNKKTLHLAIALAISSMPLFGVAEAARGSMYGGESVGMMLRLKLLQRLSYFCRACVWYLYECY